MSRDVRTSNREYRNRYVLYDKEIVNGRLIKGKRADVFYGKQVGTRNQTKNASGVVRFQDVNFIVETKDICNFQEDMFVEDCRTGIIYRIGFVNELQNDDIRVEQQTMRPIRIKQLGLTN